MGLPKHLLFGLGLRGLVLLVVVLRRPLSAVGGEAAPLLSTQVYNSDAAQGAELAPHVALAGSPLPGATATAASDEACAELCRMNPLCSWFNYCYDQDGCSSGEQQLSPRQCMLLASNGTAVPQIQETGTYLGITAGFPVRVKPRVFPGFTSVAGQGMEGSDYTCPGSVLPPGQCGFRTVVEAAMVCMTSLSCRTIVVFVNGTDGRSPLVAVLKLTNLAPDGTFVAPSVYSITRLDNRPITATYLYNSDGDTVLPTPEEVAANSTWRGCFLGRNAAMDGIQVARMSQPSAEACCRTCQAWASQHNSSSNATATNAAATASSSNSSSSSNSTNGTAPGGTGPPAPGTFCNVWNYCPAEGGCRLDTADGARLELAQNECELRFQDLVQPTLAYPAGLIAKGPNVTFMAGGPIMTAGPQIPGYTLLPGKGLFTFGRFNCSGTIRPEIQECVLQMPVAELGQYCQRDPECKAFILKQDGVAGAARSLGIFKHDANASAILFNPTGLLYLRNADDPGNDDSSGGGLSSGAVAGIAVGATVVAAAVAGVAVWALLVQRRRRMHQERQKMLAVEGVGQLGDGVAVVTCPPSSCPPSTGSKASTAGHHSSSGGGGGGGSSGDGPSSAGGGAVSTQTRLTATSMAATGLQPAPSAVLPELAQHVAAADAAAAVPISTQAGGGGGSNGSNGTALPLPLLSPASLPPGVREFVVDPSSFSYCLLPSGKPHEIGVGASGRVFKAMYNGEVVAAKELDLGQSAAMQQTFLTEAVRLHQLRHSAVVGFVGVSISGTKGVLLLEFCEGRDLYCAMELKAAGTGQRLFGWHRLGRRVAFDLARALNYLHSKAIVHMDVKSSNVLLTASGAAKLGDVGIARLLTKTYLSDLPLVGTYAWVAPEVLMGGRQCTQALDIYSYGVVLWEIVTGERPQRGRLRPPLVPQECPQEVADLIASCLDSEPDRRPTAQQIMEQVGGMLRRGGGGGGGGVGLGGGGAAAAGGGG